MLDPCINILQIVVQEDSVTIEFDGRGPFVCQLDDGITEPCTSPLTYTKLSTSTYTVNIIKANDATCNETLNFTITCKSTD